MEAEREIVGRGTQTLRDLGSAVERGLVQQVKDASGLEAAPVALESMLVDVPARVAGALAKNATGAVVDGAAWLVTGVFSGLWSATKWAFLNLPAMPIPTWTGQR